jgi:hypothetical protein
MWRHAPANSSVEPTALRSFHQTNAEKRASLKVADPFSSSALCTNDVRCASCPTTLHLLFRKHSESTDRIAPWSAAGSTAPEMGNLKWVEL